MSYLLIDFEATCCEDKTRIPREEMEIIEVGAVILDEDFNEITKFSQFVKPKIHPELTDFCKKLTTIKQEDVDNAKSFPEVMRDFYAWYKDHDVRFWASWGMYDKNQFMADCKKHKLFDPLQNIRHVNVKTEYERMRQKDAKGLDTTLRIEKMQFEGTHHRGVDDAHNLGRLVAKLFKKEEVK